MGDKKQRRLHVRLLSVIVLLLLVLFRVDTLFVAQNLQVDDSESKPLVDQFKEEIEKHGTRFHNIFTGGDLENARCVMVAATGPNYSWTLSWIQNRRREGVPFVLVEMSNIRDGELIDIWARVPALIAARHALPRAELLVYSDVDQLLLWPLVCDLASREAMTITYKLVDAARSLQLRAGWFIIRTSHKYIDHLLYSWYYKGRYVFLQDQTVLNELYRNKTWANTNIAALKWWKWPARAVELEHCGSWLKGIRRIRCLHRLRLDKLMDVHISVLHHCGMLIGDTSLAHIDSIAQNDPRIRQKASCNVLPHQTKFNQV